jgi:hypothetical protein
MMRRDPTWISRTRPALRRHEASKVRGDFGHLEARDADANGVLVSGSNDVIENLVLHGNEDIHLPRNADGNLPPLR